jgi:hypothetical protein
LDLARAIEGAYPRTEGGLAAKIVEVANQLGIHPFDLANLINFESAGTFSSDVRNRISGATGLIQFMPSTSKAMGLTTDQLAAMAPVRQMDEVYRYFSRYKGRFGTVQAVYMAVFYPKAMTWALTAAFPANVQKVNPGIRTVGDYVNLVNRRAKLQIAGGQGGGSGASGSGAPAGSALALMLVDWKHELLRLPVWQYALIGLGVGLVTLLVLGVVVRTRTK